jgi:hypothetical protein
MTRRNYEPTRIRLRQTGKLAKTSYVNELAEALNKQSSPYALGLENPNASPCIHFIGNVTTSFPSGGAALTGEMYWVKPQYIKEGQVDAAADIDDEANYTDDASVPVTNLCERPPGVDPGEGTHALPTGYPVHVFGFQDANDTATVRYITFTPIPGLIPVSLTYDSGADGTGSTSAAYTYTATFAVGGGTFNDGDPLSVVMNRPNGKTNHASHGTAMYDGSNWVLWWVDETPNTTVCA